MVSSTLSVSTRKLSDTLSSASPLLILAAFPVMHSEELNLKFFFSVYVGAPAEIRSFSTAPAETLGSWSTSPTNTTFALFRSTWSSSVAASFASSIDASSTITMSIDIARALVCAPPANEPTVNFATVSDAATGKPPIDSSALFAALPVGASSATLASGFASTSSFTSVLMTVVFPVPGPPVITTKRPGELSVPSTASACSLESPSPEIFVAGYGLPRSAVER